MILVTGATGFIGGHLIHRATAEHLPLRALVRPGSPREFLTRRGVEVVAGDVTRPGSLAAAVDGVETVVNLVGLRAEPPGETYESVMAEGTRALLTAAEAGGVKRFVQVSSVGAGPRSASRYHRAQAVAEEAVGTAPLESVILRPTLVVGPGDRLVSLYATAALPIPGNGSALLQPLWIEDMLTCLLAAAGRADLAGRRLDVGGPEAFTLRQLVALIVRATGRRRLHPLLPVSLVRAQLKVAEAFKSPLHKVGVRPRVSVDQVVRLGENRICDIAPQVAAFGFEPRPLEPALRSWLAPAAAA